MCDRADRRRVLVELTPEGLRDANGMYIEHMAAGERLYQRYNISELELLLEFVRQGREFNERQAARLEQEDRAGARKGTRATAR